MRAKEFESGLGTHTTGDSRCNEASDIDERPRLTLRALNKLRKMRELRRLELARKAADIKNMYGEKPDCSEDDSPPMIPRKTN